MRTTSNERRLMAKLVRNGANINVVADSFGVTRKTVWYWSKQDLRRNLEDKPRKLKKSKITVEVEASILAMRACGRWGTAKIQQGLLDLPKFMRVDIGVKIQGVKLSRMAINNVLRKHGVNGYPREQKAWKFFRAKRPNELWQLDLKGPFRVRGEKYWILVCIDDYSRYIISLRLFDHSPSIREIENGLKPLIDKHKPENILTDNHPFKKEWGKWCKSQNVEPLFAHPYYPQDKGKVERAIRTLTEEFINLLKKFSHWLEKGLQKWKKWYNRKRYHRGIGDMPSNLYV